MLARFTEFNFHVYSPEAITSEYNHIHYNLPSRNGFQKDLYDSVGVICNAGFELVSEALQMGKKVLVKPVHSQMEQLSNAFALKQLKYGQTMFELDEKIVEDWLYQYIAIQISYPNIANHLVYWIQDGLPVITKEYVDFIWKDVKISR